MSGILTLAFYMPSGWEWLVILIILMILGTGLALIAGGIVALVMWLSNSRSKDEPPQRPIDRPDKSDP